MEWHENREEKICVSRFKEKFKEEKKRNGNPWKSLYHR